MVKDIGLLELTGEDFLKDLKALLSLPINKIQSVAARVNTNKGFDTTEDTLKEIIREKKVKPENLRSVFKVAYFLYRESLEKDISSNDVISELMAYCEEKQIKDYKPKLDVIQSLIEVKDEYRAFKDRLSYQFGVLYTLTSVSAIHDLRAVFDDNGEIEEFVPMLVMRLILEDNRDDKKEISFQLTKEGLKLFHKTTKEYIEKIEKTEEYQEKLENDKQ